MSSVSSCLDDLLSNMQSIAEFKGKAQVVYNPEELVRLLKGTATPYIGVVYEGMSAIAEQGATQRGLAGNSVFGLYLIVDSVSIANVTSEKGSALALLSKIRANLVNVRAPSGHFWQFMHEAYSESPANKALWIQRWSTKIMLPS